MNSPRCSGLSAYAYLLDFDNAANLSSQTLGLRLTGKQEVGDDLGFQLCRAIRGATGLRGQPEQLRRRVLPRSEAGLDWPVFGFKLGYEVLEGSGTAGESFQTPLATLHKFNGWADQFLLTPGTGLQDTYLQGTAKAFRGQIQPRLP